MTKTVRKQVLHFNLVALNDTNEAYLINRHCSISNDNWELVYNI